MLNLGIPATPTFAHIPVEWLFERAVSEPVISDFFAPGFHIAVEGGASMVATVRVHHSPMIRIKLAKK